MFQLRFPRLRLQRQLCQRTLTKPHPLRVRPHLRAQSSQSISQEPPKNLFQRAQQFVRDNPYTKFSLSIVAILIGLSTAVELYKRFKAQNSPAVAIYPPKVGHFTIKRNDLLDKVDYLVSQVKKQKSDYPVLFLTGDLGTGKSELVHQYASHFASTCTKWFGLRSQAPVVLFINGLNLETLESSLKESAFALGIKDNDLTPSTDNSLVERLDTLSTAIRSKLLEKNLPWLIVVDNLGEEALPGYKAAFLTAASNADKPDTVSWRDLDGAIITVARKVEKDLPQHHVLQIPDKMSTSEGLQLFCGLCGLDSKDEDVAKLLETVQYHPLAIALSASTIKIYQSFLVNQPQQADSNALTTYQDVLQQISSSGDFLSAVMSLYLEAAVTDERYRHAFDLLGSCDLTRPLPVSVILRHLESAFYRIPRVSLAPPPVDTAIQMQKLMGIDSSKEMSYWAQIKATIKSTKPPSPSEIAAVLATSEDQVSYIRDCPLLRFKSYPRAGFEYLQVHESSHDKLPSLFTKYTIPKLNIDGLASEETQFNRSAWFRSYRTFDPKQALERYHRSLPGMSEPGVLIRDAFQSHSLSSTPINTGTKASTSDGVDYLEYQHLVSHYHRVVETLSDEVKSADNDACDTLTRKYLYPHIKHVLKYPLLSETDRTLCLYDQASIEASLSISNYQEAISKLEDVLGRQKSLLGEKNQTVAHTLADMAHLSYSADKLLEAKNLMESSIKIYEGISTKEATKSFPLEIGAAYTSLAMVCSALGEKVCCKDLLEQALGAFQTVSPEGVVSKRQRKLVSSCLTDVAHAYLALGNVLMAKKYIDLSMLAHKNLYLESHPEAVRTLNVSSIVYSLLGDKPESQKLRAEAGKQQAQLNSKPLVA